MKYLKYFFYLLPLCFAFIACNQADDICTEGGTPRMKVKFKKDGKLYTVPNLHAAIIYGEDTIDVSRQDTLSVDSLMIPLKVNGEGFTDLLLKTEKEGKASKIQITYKETSEYVSPGCGIRKIYDDVEGSLISPDPVTSIESNNSNQIHDENETVFYFHF